MITLDVGNVLLSPAHRKQLLSRLKRTLRLGERLGAFVLKLSMRRVGRRVEMVADVRDRVGSFACRVRSSTWDDAVHAIVRAVTQQVHEHALRRATVAV